MISRRGLERFCSALKIDSKDDGIVPLKLWGTQRYFIDEMCKGINDGVRHFYCLKFRQGGITTVGNAFDLYWLFTHPGLQGTCVYEKDQTRDHNRSIFTSMYESLPKRLKPELVTHNRSSLEFANRSKISYQVAGTTVKGNRNTLGQGKGVNFVHGTEMSSWADPEAVANFIASLSEIYKDRLYYFETTAKGFNDFQLRWKDAKESVSQRCIFIGWWQHERLAVSKDSEIFERYGDDNPNGEELAWINKVLYMYHHKITPEQLAWWRWKLTEEIKDEQMMMQFYPPTEDDAFIMSGYRFFDNEALRETMNLVKTEDPNYYCYRFGPTFDRIEIYPASSQRADLAVWQEPDPNGFYVIGCDPAYGSSYEADRHVIEVFRCWVNKIEQVAEYCTTYATTAQLAWVIAHLCGAYRNALVPSIMILEINGPGRAVLDEFQRLQQYPTRVYNSSNGLGDIIGAINNFLYTRQDSLQGSYNYHWRTTHDLKEYVMNLYRSEYEAGNMILKSPDLVEEMSYIQQSDSGIESSSKDIHDDRVIATALVIEGWKKMLLPDLYEANIRWETEGMRLVGDGKPPETVLGYTLQSFMRQFSEH